MLCTCTMATTTYLEHRFVAMDGKTRPQSVGGIVLHGGLTFNLQNFDLLFAGPSIEAWFNSTSTTPLPCSKDSANESIRRGIHVMSKLWPVFLFVERRIHALGKGEWHVIAYLNYTDHGRNLPHGHLFLANICSPSLNIVFSCQYQEWACMTLFRHS